MLKIHVNFSPDHLQLYIQYIGQILIVKFTFPRFLDSGAQYLGLFGISFLLCFSDSRPKRNYLDWILSVK